MHVHFASNTSAQLGQHVHNIKVSDVSLKSKIKNRVFVRVHSAVTNKTHVRLDVLIELS